DAFDWGSWDIANQTPTSVVFRKRMSLVNYSGTRFDVNIDRTVKLLTGAEVSARLNTTPGTDVQTVAFESSNTVTNGGNQQWVAQTGLVSIWILGQLTPSDSTTIAIPYNANSENKS